MSRPSRLTIHFHLGRVSNLPTVWTNVLAGAVLGRGALGPAAIVPTAIAASLFYVGGMYLNDAFDRQIDALERPERPIPAGHVTAAEVFVVGFGLLGAGLALLAALALLGDARAGAVAAGALLCGAIVLYDLWHKKNPLSPLLMGACRVLVYLLAALATAGSVDRSLGAGAAALLGYLIGLTYIAKQENLNEVKNFWPLVFLAAPLCYAPARGLLTVPVAFLGAALLAWIARTVELLRVRAKGNIPRAVAGLIAGISLVDGLLAAAHGQLAIAALCALGLPATLALQRWVAGT